MCAKIKNNVIYLFQVGWIVNKMLKENKETIKNKPGETSTENQLQLKDAANNGERMMSQCLPPIVKVKGRQEKKKINREDRLLNLTFLKGSPIVCYME